MMTRRFQLLCAVLVMGSLVVFFSFRELTIGREVITVVRDSQQLSELNHLKLDLAKIRITELGDKHLHGSKFESKQLPDTSNVNMAKTIMTTPHYVDSKTQSIVDQPAIEGTNMQDFNVSKIRHQSFKEVPKQTQINPFENDVRYKAGVFGEGVRVHDYIPAIPVGSARPKIPHIIHQTWDDENVPIMFSSYIKSWTKLHPDWEYWFWTPTEVNCMLEKYYPEYSQLYGNYSEAIFKANLMRYFIMHKYGGVYADLDLECLRPLDNWTMDNECIMSENHHVHAYIVGNRDMPEPMITFLASRPGHPFFKKAIDMLPSYKDMKYDLKLVYAGMVYEEYKKTPESRIPENHVTITHPDYFLPTYDRGWLTKVRNVCGEHFKGRNAKQEDTCKGVHDGTDGRRPKSFSYANHYWEHVIMWGDRKGEKTRIKIKDLISSAIIPL